MTQIAGDIGGLNGIRFQLGQAKGPLDDVVNAVDGVVAHLVSDTGWNGDAATLFTGAWEQDAAATSILASNVASACAALATLTGALTEAQNHCDNAARVAAAAGVRFDPSGDPVPGQSLTGAALTAWNTYQSAVSSAQAQAQQAREDAKTSLSAMLAILDPAASPDLLGSAEGSSIAALMHDYFYLPTGRKQATLAKDIGSLQSYYHDLKTGQTPLTRREAQLARADVRQVVKSLKADQAAVETLEAERLKGKWFNTTISDLLDEEKVDSRLIKIGDQIPVLDVLAATVGTYAQAKYDHELGWSWPHAVAVDGGANLLGIGAEILSAETGPFAPVIGYSVTSLFSEYTHNVPWDLDVHNHGVVAGVGLGVGQGVKDLWENDVKGAGEQIGASVEHPVAAVKSLWHSLF
ncbi:hypothetical protein GXW83_08270 [Streptacidiphilus sp. PB12-B1b]|uniref:hypothetical protein n=1 Tax=Streptacidiphilus sp. PB12-B1b TaxID=2705012 RepID=UPI0015FAAB44|nr:hypothetical protein [Streptacidiphilus sp. PB12-B1b]QMU75735.1 hypothetical protein GXW83_08270 [Streptacidiphilus sp. PB12-B1b]